MEITSGRCVGGQIIQRPPTHQWRKPLCVSLMIMEVLAIMVVGRWKLIQCGYWRGEGDEYRG